MFFLMLLAGLYRMLQSHLERLPRAMRVPGQISRP